MHGGGLLFDHMDPPMDQMALLKRCPQGSVQTVLEVELASPLDHVGEEVTEERRVLVEERRQVQCPLRCDQPVEPDLLWRQLRPVPTP
jgi:hypothetical protein